MINSIETTGSTEEEAIEAALRQLGVSRGEVSVEVIEKGKKGFLGIGNVPAKVRVSYEKKDSRTDKVQNFLSGLFERMGVEATAEITETESEPEPGSENEPEHVISVQLTGKNIGALIGRRGETLDAIQHLTNYVINSGEDERVRVNIDAENYRAKRTESLENLAKKVAAKVVKYHRSVTLEPMNAYERHVIHTALQGYEGVTTYSTGTEPNRRVVIACERTGGNGYQRYNSGSSSYQSSHSQGSRQQPRRSAPRPAAKPAAPASPEPSEQDQLKNATREWH